MKVILDVLAGMVVTTTIGAGLLLFLVALAKALGVWLAVAILILASVAWLTYRYLTGELG